MAEADVHILFTCAGRRVSLMRHFRSAMMRLGLGGRLLATDITIASPAMQLAGGQFLVPRCDDPEYIPTLRRIVAEQSVRLLVPLTDLDLVALADHRDAFAADGCTVMIGDPQAVGLCRDKAAFAAHVASAGLPAMRTVSLEAFEASPFWPAVVKPLHGSAGIGTARVNDREEFHAHLAKFGREMAVQQCVDGQEYTIDVYKARDGGVRCIVPRQRLIVRSGEVENGVTVRDDQLIAAAAQLAESLDGLWGVFCCQCRRPIGGLPYFFEVNPRFGGGSPLAIAAGADLPRYLLQDVLGQPIDADAGEFGENLLMMRYPDEVCMAVDDPSELPGFDRPRFV